METVSLGGVTLPDEVTDNVFYGFRLNTATGHFDIEIIAKGDGTIALPQADIVAADDYKQWIWTKNSLKFEFDPDTGHLLMTSY